MNIRRLGACFLVVSFFVFLVPGVQAAQEVYSGEITALLEERELQLEGAEGQLYQRFLVEITSGELKGEKVEVESGFVPQVGLSKYAPGDKVLIEKLAGFENEETFYITDYVRTDRIIWLVALFVLLVAAIARGRGVLAIAGMVLSFLVIYTFMLPRLIHGADPVRVVIQACIFLLPATFYLSHGFSRRTTLALVGTFMALVMTSLLSALFIRLTHLTGYASEEVLFLQVAQGDQFNIRGLLLAGMIIGVLGVLDDVTVSQVGIVYQLKEANPRLRPEKLYQRAMAVGRDHIASMVNTLVLVYAGAALPLLLLFYDSASTFSVLINYEIVAEEIVRTLVGSIGLVLAVPMTTLIAVYEMKQKNNQKRS